jgi:hypothetical protein
MRGPPTSGAAQKAHQRARERAYPSAQRGIAHLRSAHSASSGFAKRNTKSPSSRHREYLSGAPIGHRQRKLYLTFLETTHLFGREFGSGDLGSLLLRATLPQHHLSAIFHAIITFAPTAGSLLQRSLTRSAMRGSSWRPDADSSSRSAHKRPPQVPRIMLLRAAMWDVGLDGNRGRTSDWTVIAEVSIPPAEPGPLRAGPLKAAVGVAKATPKFLAT